MTTGGIKNIVNNLMARNLETILSLAGGGFYRRYVRDSRAVEATQLKVLNEILSYAQDTVFGREHGFARITTPSAFQKNVPIRDYEGHRPYVDRHARGESGVLFPGKPLMYNRSSGTTAKPKLLPVTPHALQRTIKDRGKLWFYGLMQHYPGVFRGRDLSLVSPAVEGHTDDGTPLGSLSGLIYQNIPEFIKRVHAIPYSVIEIEDYHAKIYTLMRISMSADVSLMVTGNPSSVLNLVVRGNEWRADIIRDIHDGTLKKDLCISEQTRAETERCISADPPRARFLEALANRSDTLRPCDYWPNLKLVQTWKNGNCALVIPKLKPWFGENIPILDFGYVASEITATDLVDPNTDGSLLQVQNAFFEFSRLEDGDDNPDRRFYMAHQLEAGARYYIYVTTFSGLYRYDMNDVLEVVGHFNQVPIVRFLYKGKGITSIMGEKLSEDQFIVAVNSAAATTNITHDFFIGYADTELGLYELYIELMENYPPERIAAFEQAVDAQLCAVNVEYDAKRHSERLKPLKVISLGKNAFDRYRALRLEEGAHIGQFKWVHLSAMEVTKARLKRLMESNTPQT